GHKHELRIHIIEGERLGLSRHRSSPCGILPSSHCIAESGSSDRGSSTECYFRQPGFGILVGSYFIYENIYITRIYFHVYIPFSKKSCPLQDSSGELSFVYALLRSGSSSSPFSS